MLASHVLDHVGRVAASDKLAAGLAFCLGVVVPVSLVRLVKELPTGSLEALGRALKKFNIIVAVVVVVVEFLGLCRGYLSLGSLRCLGSLGSIRLHHEKTCKYRWTGAVRAALTRIRVDLPV